MDSILTGSTDATSQSAPVQAAPAPQAESTTVGGFANVSLPSEGQANDAQVSTSQEASQDATQAPQSNPASDSIIGQKEEAQAKPNDNVPEKYSEFSYNDEPLEPNAQAQFADVARSLGFSQTQAQTVIKALGDYITKSSIEAVTEWSEKTRNDPEIGGRNLATTQRYANKALSNFFSPKAQEIMQQMGLFNHPDVIRGLRKVGEALSNDSPRELIGGNSQAGQALKENPLKAMYEKYNDPSVL